MRIPFTNYSLRLVNRKVLSVIHPDVSQLTEYAFTLKDPEGRKHDYYCFKNQLDMPFRRWQQLMIFKEEAAMKMTSEEMKVLLDLAEECIDHDPILIRGVIDVLKIFRYSNDMFIDTDITYRLMTCFFFDYTMNEDVTDYDEEFNKQKTKIFKSQPPDSFFFEKPIGMLLPLEDPSPEDIQVFLKQTQIKRHIIEATGEIRKKLGISKELRNSEEKKA